MSNFDFTIVISIRLHDQNPWVLERLQLLADYYHKCPPVIIVDFGSAPFFRRQISSTCARSAFHHLYIDDEGIFSLAKARNFGARAAQTTFILFSDIDFFMRPHDMSRIQELINDLGLRERLDVLLNFPAYHLSEHAARGLQTAENRRSYLDRCAFEAVYTEFGDKVEFVAPYSNVFVISRGFFELCGGYDERFRGHGSEDFEFLTRCAIVSQFHRLPARLADGGYGPRREEFFGPKSYVGYRRLLEAISLPAELTGLRAFHLHHPTPKSDPWLSANDWRRDRLNEAFSHYLKSWEHLLDVDFLPRPRRMLCVCKNPEHRGFFFPFRLAGFSITAIYGRENEQEIEAFSLALADRKYDCFAIFNPYMKSHAEYRRLFEKARVSGVETIVVERGALPGTVYYAPDVCYGCATFSEEAFAQAEYNSAQLSDAANYVRKLRSGGDTLEVNGDYAATRNRHADLSTDGKLVCFVPLQLNDDMAVTYFLRDAQRYDDFVTRLDGAARDREEIIFIVKPHPLSKQTVTSSASNVRIAEPDDNVHALIDLADSVICYNSGVGLLALLHEKPTICIGNAFYCRGGLGYMADDIDEAVDLAMHAPRAPTFAEVVKLCAWFIHKKYSFFSADDDIREVAGRRVHGYRNVAITHFRWSEYDISLTRLRDTIRFSERSYGAARVGMAGPQQLAPVSGKQRGRIPSPPADRTFLLWIEEQLVRPFCNDRLLAKYRRDRRKFFTTGVSPYVAKMFNIYLRIVK